MAILQINTSLQNSPVMESIPLKMDKQFPTEKVSKKSIRFADYDLKIPSLHINDFTESEISSTWYAKDEYKVIKEDLLDTLSLKALGKLDDESNDSRVSSITKPLHAQFKRSRGLTKLTNNTRRQRKNRLVNMLDESVRTVDQDDYSTRGLESFDALGRVKSQIRKKRLAAVDDIIEELEYQIDFQDCYDLERLPYDDEAFRRVYRKHSITSAKVAHKLANQDAIEAGITKASSSEEEPNSESEISSKTESGFKKFVRRLSWSDSRSSQRRRSLMPLSCALPRSSSHGRRQAARCA